MDMFAGAAAGFMERRGQRASLGALIDEARHLELEHSAILREPAKHAGKPVVWCVDHPSWGNAYLAGKPSEHLVLENEFAFPINSPTSGGRCTTVVAVVVGVKGNSVAIQYMGQP
jgi:hypothetical protein